MELSFVEPLLRDIGRYQLDGYRRLQSTDIQVKDGGSYGTSVVTEYDLESERRVYDALTRQFPQDSFLGEEHGNVRRNPARYWILDPIDGTSNFTQGIVYWGPTLCFWDALGPAVGWIYLPATDELFHAQRGGGAYLNGRRIHSSAVTEYSDLTTVATTSRLHRRARLSVPAKHRILGSLVVNLAYVAKGTFASSFCRANVWDVAAGILIAREAGAVVDCQPSLESLDVSAIDSTHSVSLTVHARANPQLPSLEGFLVPIT